MNDFLVALDPRGHSERSKFFRFASPNPATTASASSSTARASPATSSALSAIARSCAITLAEFIDFREWAQIERAIATMAYATPAIAAGPVKAVLPRMEVCEKCEGLGWLYVDGGVPPELVQGYLGPVPTEPDGRAARTCPFCKGDGRVEKPGDMKAARMILDITGLVEQQKTPAVQLVQTFQCGSHVGGRVELSRIPIDVSADD